MISINAPGKILLIEDDKNIVLVEQLCLAAGGYQVMSATDGVQGLEMAFAEQPALILLDVVLPKINGYLVLEALQNNPLTQNIPVLVTSAKAQADDIQRAYAYKIADYLVKPFTHQELLRKVSGILDREGDLSNENSDRG